MRGEDFCRLVENTLSKMKITLLPLRPVDGCRGSLIGKFAVSNSYFHIFLLDLYLDIRKSLL